MMAVAASAALDNAIPLFPKVHAMAKEAAKSLGNLGYELALPVQTNKL
jgi:threonine aldolase